MNNLKKTISRSFARKLNLGNYETADFFASYSEEVDSIMPQEELKTISGFLYDMAKSDVEEAMAIYLHKPVTDEASQKELNQTDWKLTELLKKVVKQARTGVPIAIEDYELLIEKVPLASVTINEAKKEYKRSDAYKATQTHWEPGEKVANAKIKSQELIKTLETSKYAESEGDPWQLHE